MAKNSATRNGLNYYDQNNYDDLYKYCLEVMLTKYDFVAAIIPESFLTANIFHEKLFAVISLTTQMFDDTECPVCLALWVSVTAKRNEGIELMNFYVYDKEELIGRYSELVSKSQCINSTKKIKLKTNDKNGKIGLRGVDNTKNESIRFINGEEIDPNLIKNTSRAITRISVPYNLSKDDYLKIIKEANIILKEYRKVTHDVFMTSFKGLREDGKYRRRLDFKTAKKIINKAIENCVNNKEINIED
ncbi:MAG: hypothetical protein LBM13_04805 [Candidatus Ancillula sp.]|nr:hypothetical protein [Candidatus Ancillula sp.]